MASLPRPGNVRHVLTVLDLDAATLCTVLARAASLRAAAANDRPLAGRTLACLFEKPSLRTRVSFEQAMRRLGGDAMSLSQAEVGLGSREAPEDVARVLSGMVDAVMARVNRHATLTRMAAAASVPVINGLSDESHPCQALADALTLVDEFSPGRPEGLRGRTVVFVGDGNNVARSLGEVCALLGVRFVHASPPAFALPGPWADDVRRRVPGFEFHAVSDPADAVATADAVACDTFVSMGQESERAARLAALAPYQVNDGLLAHAPAHAIVLHCLPAHRGEEITDAVMDGPRSRVFAQAHNRLHAQAGLLAELLAAPAGAR